MAEDESAVGIKASDPHAGTYLAVWLFFQIAADHVGLPILVATFLFAKTVKRNPTLINMCITWIIAGVSSSLLFYAGKQSGAEPGNALCILQAAMLEGTPPMVSLSAFALIYTVWASMTCRSSNRNPRVAMFWTYTLLIVPYVALFSFALATSIVAIQDLRKVNRARRFFYCSVDNNKLSNTMGIFSSVICLICLIFEFLIAVQIIRAWRAFRNFRNDTPIHRRGFDMQLILRLFIFSGYVLIGLIFNAASVYSIKSAVPDIFAASIGMGVFIIFGTQSDVLRAWAFWLPAKPPPPPPKDTRNLDGPTFDFVSPRGNFARNPTSTILSETETLSDANLAVHTHESRVGAPNVAEHEVQMDKKSSMMWKKADSVIIIGKPEEAFASMGRDKHDSV
ncbi:uncharacterized protein FOMMEDRAFT_171030 [Fomitiporia mediterranea MF3/22]|uniref:uncharacterized protein n=1 Tax=Fomitiporia mediterranea (strain MF3/22) TaxID=694068 RepID=UPI000440900F|nr:uncharacterized protein FOMMEDRAFT_171030 [Fomitiporia mediterranea MF3/22]EJC98370.1 hypothetical protein FOMMEDRAFT_171030 [Fomitiporia mediterranea MF3/22]